MNDEEINYTPLNRDKLKPKKRKLFVPENFLVSLIFILTVGIGMIGYFLVLRKPIRRAVPAFISGEATACNIKVGPPISGSEKVEGNKYSIQVPIENKSDGRKRVKINSGWNACPFNDKQTCTQGDSHNKEEEIILKSNEQKIITVTAEQPEGACGSLQIDLKLKAVKKGDDDDDKQDGEKKDGEKKEGESGDSDVKGESDDRGGWDENCNTNSTWVGGFYAFPQACGVQPSSTPTTTQPSDTPVPPSPTPTEAELTSTSTPTPTTILSPTVTPTLPPGVTPSSTPIPSNTPSASNTPGPSPTPIAVACGTKSCDNTGNPCRSGLICMQAIDGSNYCSLPEFQEACKASPSQASCCTPPGSTPTEIVLAQATSAPVSEVTTVAQVTEIPPAGVATFGKIFAVISAAVILLGLIL